MFKPNQIVETLKFDLDNNPDWSERVTIIDPPAECLPKPGADWHLIKFSDGAQLYCHETRLRSVA